MEGQGSNLTIIVQALMLQNPSFQWRQGACTTDSFRWYQGACAPWIPLAHCYSLNKKKYVYIQHDSLFFPFSGNYPMMVLTGNNLHIFKFSLL